jgi:hypothetical protein
MLSRWYLKLPLRYVAFKSLQAATQFVDVLLIEGDSSVAGVADIINQREG